VWVVADVNVRMVYPSLHVKQQSANSPALWLQGLEMGVELVIENCCARHGEQMPGDAELHLPHVENWYVFEGKMQSMMVWVCDTELRILPPARAGDMAYKRP